MKRHIEELRQLVDEMLQREPAGSQADISLLLYKMNDVPRGERDAFADAVYYYALSHLRRAMMPSVRGCIRTCGRHLRLLLQPWNLVQTPRPNATRHSGFDPEKPGVSTRDRRQASRRVLSRAQ